MLKSLPVVEQFLEETTGSSKCPPDPMPEAAIIPFYPNRILLANQLVVPGLLQSLPTVRDVSLG